MNQQTALPSPMKTAKFGFLFLGGVAAAVGMMSAMGVIDDAVTKRIMGLVIGAMALIVGNFLPKIRPLNLFGGNYAAKLAFEHLSGGILVLTGIAYIVLFAFMPLDQARPLSSIIGIGAMVVIAANWIWLKPVPRLRMIRDEAKSEWTTDQGKLMMRLLFAFFWIFSTACAKFLLGNGSWDTALIWWTTLGFGLSYAALIMVLDSRLCTQ